MGDFVVTDEDFKKWEERLPEVEEEIGRLVNERDRLKMALEAWSIIARLKSQDEERSADEQPN